MTTSSTSSSRGTDRLLWDCATIGRVADPEHDSARSRVDAQLGEELTQLLLLTLRETGPSTPHEEQLWRAAEAG